MSPKEGMFAIYSFSGSKWEPLWPSLIASALVVKEWKVVDGLDYYQNSIVNPNTITILLLLSSPYL